MIAGIEPQWLVYGVVALLALLIVWRMLAAPGKRTRDRAYKPDVLDEGQAPAARNQALIDAAPAAQVVMPPVISDALGGMGEVVAVAAQDEVLEAGVAQVAPPPPPPAPVANTAPVPEIIATPVATPGLDKAASPEQTAVEEQSPDAVAEVAPEPTPAFEPALVAVVAPVAPAPATADDLSKIKGLGPKLQTLLPTLGLSTYAQIAALTEVDLAALDPKLGPFAGRPTRDGWVEQAKYLAAGDIAGFEARFGKV